METSTGSSSPSRSRLGSNQVAKWKSRETGLSVVWADVEGKLPYNRSHERTQSNPDIASYLVPLVNGYLNVATEIFNESGVIHWNT
ncbi:hypothetical protein Pst134EA_007862 [Puccinia striiformis f. sp. tritici]|uniref:hypothetical protein n=1 Tax=Puccinia striiformis f. sp. tritici TaxID=168172 RepID=UPI0020076937|nr:hypothetical protein Pst134EA_007862 [Puccinia striiformis f. sp. tritici]KAH9470615.1 hypothetical protein Pst134EA_007862 [Puccinia striiformis f. sp. tritici]